MDQQRLIAHFLECEQQLKQEREAMEPHGQSRLATMSAPPRLPSPTQEQQQKVSAIFWLR